MLPVLNLAKRPFVNRKPVVRVQRILWSIIALLLVVNAFLFLKNREDSAELRNRAKVVRDGITDESWVVNRLLSQFVGMNPEDQRLRVEFLNQKIAERTFPWGRLFDRLSLILPPMVRLRTLDPSVRANSVRSDSSSQESAEPPVLLAINGIAASDQELYALIDAFFKHPAFHQPKLRSERTTEDGEVSFSLVVGYNPWLEDEEDSSLVPESEASAEEVSAQ